MTLQNLGFMNTLITYILVLQIFLRDAVAMVSVFYFLSFLLRAFVSVVMTKVRFNV